MRKGMYVMKNMIKRAALLLAGILVLLMAAPAALAVSVPETTQIFYVADYANVISDQTEQYIARKGYDLAVATGAELVVLTVDFMGGANSEEYANAVFDEWRLGDPEKNNGVLILMAVGEGKFWITQGSGLERSLSSGTLDIILTDNMEADFDAGDYDSAAKKTFDAVYERLDAIYGPVGGRAPSRDYGVPNQGKYSNDYIIPSRGISIGGVWGGLAIVPIIFVIVILIVIVSVIRALVRPLTWGTRRYRGTFWGGPYWGGGWGHHHHHHHGPRHFGGGPRPPRGGGFGGGFGGGGGGRIGGGGSRGGFGGGGGRVGGGGGSRGGGAGRR